MNQDGIWLSILDYAAAKKTSISTIRRSIKAGHVKHKEENGKYFIWTKTIGNNCSEITAEKKDLALQLDLEFFKKQNRELVEELNDLKMLLSVYENQTIELPPIPEIEL
jgi:hypothetical protein